MGRVVDPGPVVKKVMTKSSNERVKASKAPASTPGRIIGKVTRLNVIHSFALQEMRIKQDVIPGTTIQVWFVPKVTTDEMRQRTGNPDFGYEISCAQLCGLGHYRMRGYVTIDTPEQFQAWLDTEVKKAKSGAEDEGWG